MYLHICIVTCFEISLKRLEVARNFSPLSVLIDTHGIIEEYIGILFYWPSDML